MTEKSEQNKKIFKDYIVSVKSLVNKFGSIIEGQKPKINITLRKSYFSGDYSAELDTIILTSNNKFIAFQPGLTITQKGIEFKIISNNKLNTLFYAGNDIWKTGDEVNEFGKTNSIFSIEDFKKLIFDTLQLI